MPTPAQYETIQLAPFSGGLFDGRDPKNIRTDQSPALEQIDFDRESVASAGGALKMGNRPAPTAGILFRPDPSYSPLSIDAGISVPMRSYGYLGYYPELDMGGDFAVGGEAFAVETYHTRRQRLKQWGVGGSFRIPSTEKLFAADSRGLNSPGVGAEGTGMNTGFSYDLGLDECTVLYQKGGDRLSPMSCFIGVVNCGNAYGAITGDAPGPRPSNYALCFGWLDAAGWGHTDPRRMRYSVGAGGTPAASGAYSTLAYRVIVFRHFVEPGRDYHVAVEMQLDSGTPGVGATPTAAWNQDGVISCSVTESSYGDESAPLAPIVCSTATSGVFIWKGPTDSIEYLKRYGVRYSSVDASFIGLGHRMSLYRSLGHLPIGHDGWPLEKGGFVMVDRSSFNSGALTPPNTLQVKHTNLADTYLEFNYRFLYDNGGATQGGGFSPIAYDDVAWTGLGDVAVSPFNAEALRGYRVWTDGGAPANKGCSWTLGAYSEVGASYRIQIIGQATGNILTFAYTNALITCLRWSQRPTVFGEWSVWNAARDRAALTTTALRRTFDLSGGHELDDLVLADSGNLLACWTLDDGEGGVLREKIAGRHGYVAPAATPVSRESDDGPGTLFLSGEMEGLTLDLSKNPIFMREFGAMQKAGVGGIAIQMKLILTEGFYGRRFFDAVANESQFRYTPHIAEWTVKGDERAGFLPRPLMRWGMRGRIPGNTSLEWMKPAQFGFEVGLKSDSRPGTMDLAWPGGGGGGTFYFDPVSAWIGREVTIQFGIQPTQTGTPGKYDCYMAFLPKALFNNVNGDPGEVELDHYISNQVLDAKELTRSVICIGGAFDCAGARGYSELSCRMLVKEVQIFGTTAPGVLSNASGTGNLLRNGKLQGANAGQRGVLTTDDLLLPLGDGVRAVDLVEGTTTVNAPGRAAFYLGDTSRSNKGIADTFLFVAGDTHEQRAKESVPTTRPEFYAIKAVAIGGASLQLRTPYDSETRQNAAAFSVRTVGYTAFEDDIRDRRLTIGGGGKYAPGTSTIADVEITGDMFFNKAPLGVNFAFRIYNPMSRSSIAAFEAQWVRGVHIPRANAIRGLHDLDGTRFAGAASCLYELDDRWREDAPRDNGEWSIAFRASREAADGVQMPLENDLLLARVANEALLTNTGFSTSFDAGAVERARYFEGWVKLDNVARYQTMCWLGSLTDNPNNLPGYVVDTLRVNVIVRFNNGQPEFVLPSTVASAAGVPEKGLYVAQGTRVVPGGEWTHVRWQLERIVGSTWLRKPRLWINGREIAVIVNAVEAGAAGLEWIHPTQLINTYLPATYLALGASRDSYIEPEDPQTFVENVIAGQALRPQRLHGWMHSLAGSLAGFRMGFGSTAALTQLGNFQPEQFLTADEANAWDAAHTPSGVNVVFFGLQDGVGCRPVFVDHLGASARSVLRSHPFIGLYFALGQHDRPFCFAEHGNRLFVTNGGRSIVHDTALGYTRPNGLLPPTTAPRFSIERHSLWLVNRRTTGDSNSDPFPVSGTDVADKDRHYSTYGNSFLLQRSHDEMRWERNDAGAANATNDVIAFKCLWKPRDTAGRIPLFYERDSLAAGGFFIECRDGKLVCGWYDTDLKQEQIVSTSSEVFLPGHWHDVFVSKYFPKPSVGNLAVDIYDPASATQRMCDRFIVRPFPLKDDVGNGTGVPVRETNFDAKADHPGNVFHPASQRNCISFTPFDASDTDAKFAAIGRVTATTLTVAISAVVGNTATFTRGGGTTKPFHGDMYGMLIEYLDVGGTAHLARITKITSQTVGTLTTIDGVAPVANAAQAKACVSIGVKLVPSSNFAASDSPDSTLYDIECFGSALSGTPLNGVSRSSGEFGSFGYVVVRETATNSAEATALGPIVFSNDYNVNRSFVGSKHELENGTDKFAGHIYSATAPGNLQFDAGGTNFTAIQSTQPNLDLEVAQDAFASANAEPLFWEHLQDIDLFAGTRRVYVTFFDPIQNATSQPGPVLTILPAIEDAGSPSGDARILLEGLPISSEGDVFRRVYMTQVDGNAAFLIAEIPDNSSTSISIFKSEQQIIEGRDLDFLAQAPPRCAVIADSQSVMAYGNLVGQADGVRYSEPGRPSVVPIQNFLIFPTGDKSEVMGMADLDGKLLVFKGSNAIFSALIAQGLSSTRKISGGFGLVSQQSLQLLDDSLFGLDVRGPYVLTPGGTPIWLGRGIRELMKKGVDGTELRWATGAINRARNQYLFSLPTRDAWNQEVRVSAEFDHAESGAPFSDTQARMRLSRYRHPALTAMATALRRLSGHEVVIGGDEHGFAWWLDRVDTSLVGTGITFGYGSAGPFSVLAADAFTITFDATGAPDLGQVMSTYRGTVVRWGAHNAYVLAVLPHPVTANAFVALVDRPIPAADIPAGGSALTFGDPSPFFETKWLDLGKPHARKRAYVLDVFRAAETAGGSLRVTLLVDNNDASVADIKDIDLSTGLDIGLPLEFAAQFIKLRFERVAPATYDLALEPLDRAFEITSATLRAAEQERN